MLKKFAVTLAIFIPVASALAAPVTPAGLLGTWRSDDTSGGSDKGTMVLKKGGEVADELPSARNCRAALPGKTRA